MTTHTGTNHPAPQRAPEFDAALVAYLPALRRQAKYMAGMRHEELLQDAVTDMLHLADRCRMGTFRTWAQIILRRSASNFLRAARQAKRAGVCVPDTAAHIAVQPSQEGAADLAAVLTVLGSIPDGNVVLREAMGDTLTDMGRERGISREAMRQRRELARGRLNDKMRMAA
ncbi:sigma-70 family RNA polymerase sigma factor [Rhizobium leguminosarum]